MQNYAPHPGQGRTAARVEESISPVGTEPQKSLSCRQGGENRTRYASLRVYAVPSDWRLRTRIGNFFVGRLAHYAMGSTGSKLDVGGPKTNMYSKNGHENTDGLSSPANTFFRRATRGPRRED